MKTYVVYYTLDGVREGFEVCGVRSLKEQIAINKKAGGSNFEVFKLNDPNNDRDNVTFMPYRTGEPQSDKRQD